MICRFSSLKFDFWGLSSRFQVNLPVFRFPSPLNPSQKQKNYQTTPPITSLIKLTEKIVFFPFSKEKLHTCKRKMEFLVYSIDFSLEWISIMQSTCQIWREISNCFQFSFIWLKVLHCFTFELFWVMAERKKAQ